jgi:hypothetical protein
MVAKSRALLSRSGVSHPLGKCEDRLDIPVPAALKEKISAVAVLYGKGAAEWARDALEKLVEGELAFMRRRVNGEAVPGDGRKEG